MMDELTSMEEDMALENRLGMMGMGDRMLDLVFVLDTTGSMGSYIDVRTVLGRVCTLPNSSSDVSVLQSATANIELICNEASFLSSEGGGHCR